LNQVLSRLFDLHLQFVNFWFDLLRLKVHSCLLVLVFLLQLDKEIDRKLGFQNEQVRPFLPEDWVLDLVHVDTVDVLLKVLEELDALLELDSSLELLAKLLKRVIVDSKLEQYKLAVPGYDLNLIVFLIVIGSDYLGLECTVIIVPYHVDPLVSMNHAYLF
jgi:hypothetical protein